MHTRLALIALLVTLLASGAAAQNAPADLAQRVADLPPHPRLFLTDDDLHALRTLHDEDPTLQRYVRDALAEAEACLGAEPLKYEKRGPRLLHVSRACLRRIQALTLAYRWTGRDDFAAQATAELLTVCAFPDWNPSHFLDVAEMTHAVALGYDWLHDILEDERRARIARGLRELVLSPGIAAYEGRGAWWTRSAFNWNQVCNAGLIIGALAVAEDEPEIARKILASAIESLPIALASYEPDGAWMEGPAYWGYATRYTAYGLDALHTALGTDFGLGDRDGLRAAGWFPLYTAGPTGRFFNYADASSNARRHRTPCLFWLGERYGEPAFAAAEHRLLEDEKAEPWHVVWYVPAGDDPLSLDRSRLFRGNVPVAIFRSAIDDPDALFVAIKGGYNQVNHGHLDLGSFVLDALGERWAFDLGSDDYNLPGYWDKQPGGKRWSYYRLSSESHNVPLVDGAPQDPLAVAELVSFSDAPPRVVLDLGSAYAPTAEQTRRGLAVLEWKLVLVQDELELTEPCTVRWGLTTRAAATVRDDGDVVLAQHGDELLLRVLAPADGEWSVTSAERSAPERDNRGVRRVELRVAADAGQLRIAVQLCPVWSDRSSGSAPLRALEDW